MTTKTQAAIEDLYRVPENGKAEIVNGELILMSPTGDLPSRAAFNVASSLREFARGKNIGRAYPDNTGYKVNLPDRDSFSPDASFYTGKSTGMKFLEGAPVFAVEVRSEFDYGKKAEAAILKKRNDYFTAGTLVVWDVDLLGEDTIKVYRASDPNNPTIYRRGETAEADPAVPGWRMLVAELFD
ncbi:MAG: Uma2 family endonuclease [Acidobacteria bacterium]|nr:MAG: Uma2 family endonuclease [Acidobacteriota bacterium]